MQISAIQKSAYYFNNKNQLNKSLLIDSNCRENNNISNIYYLPPSFKSSMKEHLQYGAKYLGNGKTEFTYLAPNVKSIALELVKNDDYMHPVVVELDKKEDTFSKTLSVEPHTKYRLLMVTNDYKAIRTHDPYADYLPNDIAGYKKNSSFAEVINHKSFKWDDGGWMQNRSGNQNRGWHLPSDMVIEDLHIGLLGGFKNAKKKLNEIADDKVVNTVKLMPIGEFYGEHNWGYDEACKYAVENSYGTPDELKDFVNEAHKKNIRVILDIVPNHFGPIGTNIDKFIPVFSQNKETPWGRQLEFNKHDYVTNYMTNMMMNWAVNYHIDGFRMDATHNMDSDIGLRKITQELRSHDETKDLILYPEDMRISRAMANKSQSRRVNEYNWGFDGLTTFDFFKNITALGLGHTNRGVNPDVFSLENTYKRGVNDTHEEIMLRGAPIPFDLVKYYYNVTKMPWFNSDNLLVNLSNHDEIGNDAGGRRNIVNVLYQRLGTYDKFNGNWQKANDYIFKMTKSYLENGVCLSETEQRAIGCNNPVKADEFDKQFKDSFAINKLLIGSTLMHPSPKEFFMGDIDGEIEPFKYFCSLPKEDNLRVELNNEKGYDTGKQAFLDSRPSGLKGISSKKYDEIKDFTKKFTSDFNKVLRKNNPSRNASFDNIVTYSHPDKQLLEVKYYDQYDNEIIAVMNFSHNKYNNFTLRTTYDISMKEEISSTSKKYGGYRDDNTRYYNSNNVTIEPYSIALYTKIK